MKTQDRMQARGGWTWARGMMWSLAAALGSAGAWVMYAASGWPTWKDGGAAWAVWSGLLGLASVGLFVRAWPSGMGRAGVKTATAGLFTVGVIFGVIWGSLDTMSHPVQSFVSPWLMVGALCAAGALLCLWADEE